MLQSKNDSTLPRTIGVIVAFLILVGIANKQPEAFSNPTEEEWQQLLKEAGKK